MFSFLFLFLVLCVGSSFANPWSIAKDFSFSSLGVRSADDITELKSPFDSSNSISADVTSWGSNSPSSFQWNEATAAQILSTDTAPNLLPVLVDSEISGTPDSNKIHCRAQVRGKVRIRDYNIDNQEIGEGRQFCSPADAPAFGGKPLNLIAPPENGVQPPAGTDQPQEKVQQEKDKRADEQKQNELRSKNTVLPNEDPNKCRYTPYRIRLDCDGFPGEARVSVFGLDYKEIWNCYPGTFTRQRGLCLTGLKSFS